MSGQTVIPLGSHSDHSLQRFVVGRNGELFKLLKEAVQSGTPASVPRLVYFWGESGTGKTHLLHGMGELAEELGRPHHYLSLDNMQGQNRILEQLLSGSLVCADNLFGEVVSADNAVDVLGIYERVLTLEGQLILAASGPPQQMAATLPDLVSRLSAGACYQLLPLGDGDKRRALKMRAESRGFDLDEAVVEFIMRHCARDTSSLFTLLDRIDSASLASQRRVTIPFIRQLLSN